MNRPHFRPCPTCPPGTCRGALDLPHPFVLPSSSRSQTPAYELPPGLCAVAVETNADRLAGNGALRITAARSEDLEIWFGLGEWQVHFSGWSRLGTVPGGARFLRFGFEAQAADFHVRHARLHALRS